MTPVHRDCCIHAVTPMMPTVQRQKDAPSQAVAGAVAYHAVEDDFWVFFNHVRAQHDPDRVSIQLSACRC